MECRSTPIPTLNISPARRALSLLLRPVAVGLMPSQKLRLQIAAEAARLMYDREETEYLRAKNKAARRLCRGRIKPADLPSNAEIRDAVQATAQMMEGGQRRENLRQMRIDALRMMRILARFRPRLIGSVLTGHVRRGSDIDLHLFSDAVASIGGALEHEGLPYEVERKQVTKRGETRTYIQIHVRDRFPFELTVYAANQAHEVFRSSITGKAMERANLEEVETLLRTAYPGIDIESEVLAAAQRVDRFAAYEALLLPLENVQEDPRHHPEGDALYHSLQVFHRASQASPYDEELLTAALLHDVGKAIDPQDHVAAGIEALEGLVTQRTAWLIEHHMLGHQLLDGRLGIRARRRLEQSEYRDDLRTLAECDRAGREPGATAPELDEALEYLRELSDGRI